MGKGPVCTHSFHGFNHPIPHHYNPQSPSGKRTNGHVSLDATQPTTLLAALLQKSHRPQLLQDFAFDFLAEGVAIRIEGRQLVRQLSEGSAQRVVLLVLEGLLDVVSLTDGVLAVIGVGLVRVKVDFAEEPVRVC